MRDPAVFGKAALAAVVLALHGGCLLAMDVHAPRTFVPRQAAIVEAAMREAVIVEARFIAPRDAVVSAPILEPAPRSGFDADMDAPHVAMDPPVTERIDTQGTHAAACRGQPDAPLPPEARHDMPLAPEDYADRAWRDRCKLHPWRSPDS